MHMKHVIATYTVKKGKASEAKKLISEFVEKLKNEPGTILHEVFQQSPTQFVHFIVFKDETAEELHKKATYTKVFTEKLLGLCTKKPSITNLQLLNSTRH